MTEAIDHLAGKSGNTTELLRELTDDQLRETMAYWSKREAAYRAAGPDGKPYGNNYAAWWCTKKQSTIWSIMNDRSRTELTDDEAERLWNAIQGGRFSGAARRIRSDIIEEHGWTDEEVQGVTASLAQRFAASSSAPGSDAATEPTTAPQS